MTFLCDTLSRCLLKQKVWVCPENDLEPGIAKSPTRLRIIKIPLKSLLFQVITMRSLAVNYPLANKMQNISLYCLTMCNAVLLGINVTVAKAMNICSGFYVCAH